MLLSARATGGVKRRPRTLRVEGVSKGFLEEQETAGWGRKRVDKGARYRRRLNAHHPAGRHWRGW